MKINTFEIAEPIRISPSEDRIKAKLVDNILRTGDDSDFFTCLPKRSARGNLDGDHAVSERALRTSHGVGENRVVHSTSEKIDADQIRISGCNSDGENRLGEPDGAEI